MLALRMRTSNSAVFAKEIPMLSKIFYHPSWKMVFSTN